MDFQKILELASKNQKAVENQVTKRYSSKVPPPKKEPRPRVDPDAIRARIDAKEQAKRQKEIDEEQARKEGAVRYKELERKLAEQKRDNRRAGRRARTNPESKSKRATREPAEDSPERSPRPSSQRSSHEPSQKSSHQSSQRSLHQSSHKSSQKSPHPTSQKSLIKSARQSADDAFSRRAEASKYQDKQHEDTHKSFMHKVEKGAERNRERMIKKEERTPRHKPKKKSGPIPKKPMSYEELLKFAQQQKTGGGSKKDAVQEEEESEEEEEESEEEEYETRPRGRDDRHYNRDREQSRESKIKERLKEERMKKIPHLNGQKNEPDVGSNSQKLKDRNKPHLASSRHDGNTHRHGSDADRNAIGKSSGKINAGFKRKDGKDDGFKKPIARSADGDDRKNGMAKSRPDGKPIHRSAERPLAKTGGKMSGGDARQPSRQSEKHPVKTSDKTKLSEKHPARTSEKAPVSPADRQPRPAEKMPSRPSEKARMKSQGRPESRPVSGKTPRPREHQEGRSRDQTRPVSHDRDRPRPSGMGPPRGPPIRGPPPRGPEVSRKRPAKPPIMHVKRGRIMVSDSEESDYDDGDGFIDDTPIDDGNGADVSSAIQAIFGYDKSKYGYESDYALRAMDASYKDIQREEARSTRLGMLEDLEDMRKEKEDLKRKAMKKGKKR